MISIGDLLDPPIPLTPAQPLSVSGGLSSELSSFSSLDTTDLSQRFVPSSIPNENPNFNPLEYFESFLLVQSESEGEDPYDLRLSVVPDSEDDDDCAMLLRNCAKLRRNRWLKDSASNKRLRGEDSNEPVDPILLIQFPLLRDLLNVEPEQWLEAEERWMAPTKMPKWLRGEESNEPVDPILLIQFPLLRDLVSNDIESTKNW